MKGSRSPKNTPWYHLPPARASGGIGRRAGFRCLCPKGCGGSSPPSPTTTHRADATCAARRAGRGSHGLAGSGPIPSSPASSPSTPASWGPMLSRAPGSGLGEAVELESRCVERRAGLVRAASRRPRRIGHPRRGVRRPGDRRRGGRCVADRRAHRVPALPRRRVLDGRADPRRHPHRLHGRRRHRPLRHHPRVDRARRWRTPTSPSPRDRRWRGRLPRRASKRCSCCRTVCSSTAAQLVRGLIERVAGRRRRHGRARR